MVHSPVIVHLDYRRSLKHHRVLVDRFRGPVLLVVCFFDDGSRLSRKGTLVDHEASFDYNAVERHLYVILEEDDISGDNFEGGEGLNQPVPEHVDLSFIVHEGEDLIVELDHLVEIGGQAQQGGEEDEPCK